MLPNEAWFWTVVVIVGGALVALAIWLAENVSVAISGKGLTFKMRKRRQQKGTADAAGKTKVSVGEGAEISGQIDHMTGQRVEGATALDRTTEVGKGAKISGGVGEMTGLDIRGSQRD